MFKTLPNKLHPSQWKCYTRSDWRFVFSPLLFFGFGVAAILAFFNGSDSFPAHWKIAAFFALSTILQIWA